MAVRHAILMLEDMLQDQNLSPRMHGGLSHVSALLNAYSQMTPLPLTPSSTSTSATSTPTLTHTQTPTPTKPLPSTDFASLSVLQMQSARSCLLSVEDEFEHSKRSRDGRCLKSDVGYPHEDLSLDTDLYRNAVLLRLKRNLQLSGWTTTTTAAGLPSLELPPARPRSSSLIAKSFHRSSGNGGKEQYRAFRNLVSSRKRSLVAYHNGALRVDTGVHSGGNTPRSPLICAQSNSCEHISCLSASNNNISCSIGLNTAVPSPLSVRQLNVKHEETQVSIAVSVSPAAGLQVEVHRAASPVSASASLAIPNAAVEFVDSAGESDVSAQANVAVNAAMSPSPHHRRKAPKSPRRSPRSSTIQVNPNAPPLPAAARALIDHYNSTSDSSDSEFEQDGSRSVKDLHAHSLLSNKELKKWDYPIFQLDAALGNNTLSKLAYKVFNDTGLLQCFKVPVGKFLAYFHAAEVSYGANSYHNYLHAADVLHACYYLTVQPVPGLRKRTVSSADQSSANEDSSVEANSPTSRFGFCNFRLDDEMMMAKPNAHASEDASKSRCHYGIIGSNLIALELLALYTAAVMHDYDHSGYTNAFLVETRHPLAILYNDRSVLENHHAAQAWQLLTSSKELNWLSDLDSTEMKRFRFLFIELILATDLKRHFEYLTEMSSKSSLRASDDVEPGVDWQNEVDRLLVMQMIIKMGDLSGPTKSKDLHLSWVSRVTDEFYHQGDEEARRGMNVTPFMSRADPRLPKLEVTFINHVVMPFISVMSDAQLLPGYWNYCRTNEGEKWRVECVIHENLVSNLAMWEELMQDEELNTEN